MKKLVNLAFFTAVLCLTQQALAGSESGAYLGGSFGNAELDYSSDYPEFGRIDVSDEDTGYKIFAGYNLGIVPLLDIAIEGTYIDFGNYTDTAAELDINGWNLAGLAGVNLGPVGVFGKAGFIDWDSEFRGISLDRNDSGTDPAYGVGAKIHVWSIGIRAEYEIFETDSSDIDFYSIGASITF